MRRFSPYFLYFLLFYLCLDAGFAEKPFVVVIPSYNNQLYVERNLASVFQQHYSNYEIIYIDDASSDGTADAVHEIAKRYKKEDKVTLIRNEQRQGGLYNLYHAIHSCANHKIIICLDGDDWLAHPKVFKKLNQVYSTKKVWLTHGSFLEYPDERWGWSIPIPEEIVRNNAFRSYRCPSHLKTFYAWLFKKIALEDLQDQGEFFRMTQDQAIMFPMIEMAGERHAFISDIIYIYNTSNPLNDNKIDPQLQNDLERLIRSKTPYTRLKLK